jgi:hypothetical protein
MKGLIDNDSFFDSYCFLHKNNFHPYDLLGDRQEMNLNNYQQDIIVDSVNMHKPDQIYILYFLS